MRQVLHEVLCFHLIEVRLKGNERLSLPKEDAVFAIDSVYQLLWRLLARFAGLFWKAPGKQRTFIDLAILVYIKHVPPII